MNTLSRYASYVVISASALYAGCSDSRKPENTCRLESIITGIEPVGIESEVTGIEQIEEKK